jgi:hypothetical protein
MGVTIKLENPKRVASRSEMLRALMTYDCKSPNEIRLSDKTIEYLKELSQDSKCTLTTDQMEMYVAGFISALDLCLEEKDIGAMMDSFLSSTLATYFCCNRLVSSSCVRELKKDHKQFERRAVMLHDLSIGNIDQLTDRVRQYESDVWMMNYEKSFFSGIDAHKHKKQRPIHGWENRRLGPVLKPGDDLIL